MSPILVRSTKLQVRCPHCGQQTTAAKLLGKKGCPWCHRQSEGNLVSAEPKREQPKRTYEEIFGTEDEW